MGAQEELWDAVGNAVVNVVNKIIKWVTALFEKVFAWLKRIGGKIAELLPGRVVQGVKTLAAKVGGILKNVSKAYTKNAVTGEWEETVFQQNVDENEVPDWIKAKLATSNEVDYTEELVNEYKQAS